MTEWRSIPEHEQYQVSDEGDVAFILRGSGAGADTRYSLMRDGKTYYRSRRALLASVDESMAAEWQRLEEFPRYEINLDGHVRRRLGLTDNGNGYLYAHLAGRKWAIHILVCSVFIGPKPHPKAEVAHWDNDRGNNRRSNLRWTTHRDNERDKIRHGTATPKGLRNPNGKLSDDDVIAIRLRKAAGESAPAIAARFGIHEQTVCCIARGAKRRYVPMPDIRAA